MAYVRTRRRGLGQVTGAQQTAGTVGQVGSIAAAPAAGAIGGALSTTTAGVTTILGMAPVVAIPIIGAALAGVTFAVTKLIANSGCGPTCIRSTQYANQAGDLMAKNLNAYLALPAPRSRTAQTVAIQNFDSLWAQLVNLCTNDPELAGTTAGRNCIADRQAGACKWRASPGGWSQSTDGTWSYRGWGAAGSGSDCWNWFVGFRDPIQNDPVVVDDTQVGAAAPAASGGPAAAAAGLLPGGVGPVGSAAAVVSAIPVWVWVAGAVGVYLLVSGNGGGGFRGRR
jgi:hypothetical protein